ASAGNGSGPNHSGMVLAVVQTLSVSRRTSFVGSKRPSRFQSLSVPSSTGPYSFSPTRTSHRSAIDRLIAKEQLCHPERKSRDPAMKPLRQRNGIPRLSLGMTEIILFSMKLLLIDGHYYAYCSFFAIQNLSISPRAPTNAIFGVTKTLR